MQRIKMHLLNKKIVLVLFFPPNGRFINEICQMGLPLLLASLSNGELGKTFIPFGPTSPFHLQALISSSWFRAGRDGQIRSGPTNQKGSLKVGPVLDTDLGVGASFKFHLLYEAISLPEMKGYTGWWGKMSSSWRRQDMKAAPRTGVTGGHQVHTQIKAASTEWDFP